MEERKLLQSWKEISNHLNCSLRTCHRWEEDLDLPVHRLDGTPKARVFAYSDELDRWRTEKFHSREGRLETPEELRRRKHKRVAIAASVILAVAAISVLAWRLFLSRSPSPPAIKPTLAVLPFENLSGTEALDWLRTGLPELITTDLLQSQYLDVMSGDRVYSVLKELKLVESGRFGQEDLVRVAKKANIDHLGSGSFMKAGESIIIAFSLQDMRGGERISSRRITCQGEAGISDGIDRLTREIKKDLALTPRQIAYDVDMKVGRITTSSPEALKYYMEARREWEKGTDKELVRSLIKKAIEIDPSFAMAYRSMGIYLSGGKEDQDNRSRQAEQAEYLKKALDLKDRVSIRERYIIQGTYFELMEKDVEKALNAYKELLELYPDDYHGNSAVIRLYSMIPDWGNAIKYCERLYEKDRTSRELTLRLAFFYRNIGASDKAIGVFQYYLDNQWVGDIGLRRQLYDCYWRSGRFELALKEADRIEATDPREEVDRIYPYYLMGNYPAAEKLCEAVIRDEAEKEHWAARDWLQNIYLTQGQFEKAKEQILLGLQEEGSASAADLRGRSALRDRLARIYLIEGELENAMPEVDLVWDEYKKHEDVPQNLGGYQWLALETRAEIYLEMKRFDKAQETANTIRELIRKKYAGGSKLTIQSEMIRYDLVQGKIELKKGKLSKAIDHLQRARAQDAGSPPIFLTSAIVALAAAYEQAGKLAMAREEYEKVPLLTNGRLLDGYTYAGSFYALGKICERQNDRAKAIEYYGKFLELWKNADPGLPEVEDARKRLAGLKGS